MRPAIERLQSVFDSLDYHVALYDADWRYTYVNLEAARVLGRPADELLGRSIWELFLEAVGNEYYRSCTRPSRPAGPCTMTTTTSRSIAGWSAATTRPV